MFNITIIVIIIMIIGWNHNYEIGDMTIDSQHKDLFERVNKLYINDLDDYNVIEELLSFLLDYVIIHFRTEERMMQEIKFIGYPEHKKIHDEFIISIKKMVKEYYDTGKSIETINSIRKIASSWLIDHIINMDMMFKQEFIENELILNKLNKI